MTESLMCVGVLEGGWMKITTMTLACQTFFRQGFCTFDMKATAEEDYFNTVDDMAKDYNSEAHQEWAKNVQDNNYWVSLLKTFAKFDIDNCEN